MESRIEVVTPKMAGEYLAKNRNIRKISAQWVRYFEVLLRRGEFELTPDGVCFSPQGYLVNGQHRLQAIVNTGISAKMRVYEDVTPAQLAAMDQGRKRHVADITRLPRNITDALSLGARIATGATHYPPSYLEALASDAPGSAALALVGKCGHKTKVFSAAPVKLAAITTMVDGGDWDYVTTTYRALALHDIESMTPIALAFTRQVFAGIAAATDATDLLVRAFDVFDKSKRMNSKVQVGDSRRAEARERVRRVLAPFLGIDSPTHEQGPDEDTTPARA